MGILNKLPTNKTTAREISYDSLKKLRNVYLRVCQDDFVFKNGRFPLREELDAFQQDVDWIKFLEVSKSVKEYIVKSGVTDLFVFNGRPMILRLLEVICKEEGINFHISEILGGSENTLTYFSSRVTFWDLHSFSLEISQYYQNAISSSNENKVNSIAENYYQRRILGKDAFLKEWLKDTISVPIADSGKKICSFFFSSIDELPAFNQIDKEINYLDQISLVRQISKIIRDDFKQYQFVVKVHPRMVHEKKLSIFMRDVLELGKDGINIVPMNTNPYELISQSDVVCASVSSIAWDATFAGKCAIIFGGSWAMAHDAHHTVDNWEEFRSIMKNPKAKDIKGALPVAYFIETAGDLYTKKI